MLVLFNKMEQHSTDLGKSLGLPVEGSIVQQNLNADVLFQKAVSQDGHRGEADVVHRQIGRVIQGLGRMGAGGGSEGKRVGKEEQEGWGNQGLISREDKTHTHHHTCTYNISYKQAYIYLSFTYERSE